MTFDPSLPTRTRDGRKVRILATDHRDEQPIVAIVEGYEPDDWHNLETYFSDGIFDLSHVETGWDLVNVDA